MARAKPTDPDLLVDASEPEPEPQTVDPDPDQGVDETPEPRRRRIRILDTPTNQGGLYYAGKTHPVGSTTGVLPLESATALVDAGYAAFVDDDAPDEPDQSVDDAPDQQNGG
jgi:hypothetical protein